jgi:hypothetical protein
MGYWRLTAGYELPVVNVVFAWHEVEPMELADPRMIEELLATHAKISRGRTGRQKAALIAKDSNARHPKVRRCHCGTCPRCLEEARWDRIFNERFADPDYYKKRPAHFGSSMGWLAGHAAN